jgi:hypothetical protein
MRPLRFAVPIAVASALVLSACGGSGDSGGSSSGSSTTAAKAQVVFSGPYASHKDPWYVWNKKTCQYDETTNHPAEYTASLRKADGLKVVYTPEGTQADFDKTLNNATRDAAKQAGMGFFQFSNEYPSTTLPLSAADQAITVKPNVVISANVDPSLYPQIQDKYQKACVPFINEYNMANVKQAPAFQTDNYGTGAALAKAAAEIIKQRKWPTDQIYILSCVEPTVAHTAGTVYDIPKGYRETLQKELNIPAANVVKPDLSCKFAGGPEGARKSVADWLTAHPNAKYVTAGDWADDVYSVGIANALRDAKFGDRALVAGRGGGAVTIKQISSGDPINALTADPNFPAWGPRVVSMAQDIAQGRPVPALASPEVKVVTKDNASG